MDVHWLYIMQKILELTLWIVDIIINTPGG